jgi:hypothetical protein
LRSDIAGVTEITSLEELELLKHAVVFLIVVIKNED